MTSYVGLTIMTTMDGMCVFQEQIAEVEGQVSLSLSIKQSREVARGNVLSSTAPLTTTAATSTAPGTRSVSPENTRLKTLPVRYTVERYGHLYLLNCIHLCSSDQLFIFVHLCSSDHVFIWSSDHLMVWSCVYLFYVLI